MPVTNEKTKAQRSQNDLPSYLTGDPNPRLQISSFLPLSPSSDTNYRNMTNYLTSLDLSSLNCTVNMITGPTHGDVKHSTGNIVSHVVINRVWCL